MSDMKLEMDIAEEQESTWGSQHQCSGTKTDRSENSVNSTITPHEIDCRTPSTAAEPHSQSSSGHCFNTELVDIVTGDTFQPASQPAIVPGIKAEPVDDSVTGDTFQPASQPAIIPCIKAEPVDDNVTGDVFHQFQSADKEGKVDIRREGSTSADSSSSSLDPWIVVKFEDCEPAFSNGSDVESEVAKADSWKGGLDVNFGWQTGLKEKYMINDEVTSDISSNIKTSKSEEVTADLTDDDVQKEAVTTYISEAISNRAEKKSRQEGVKQNEGICIRTTPQPSANDRTPLQKSANTSGSRLPLKTSYVCQQCSAAFVLLSSWKQHMASVHGEKLQAAFPESCTPEGCDVGHCGNIDIKKKVGILADRKSKGKKKDRTDDNQTEKTCMEKDRPHVCDVCCKAFTQASDLKKHTLIHTGLKQFVCDVCRKAFTQAGHLKTHKLIHTGLKQFVCDVCSKAFTKTGSLKRHKLIHAGLKKFVCDVCSKAFTKALDFKRHMSIHTGVRQFVCDVCCKVFTVGSSLKRHKLIHTGLKQFVCDVCSKAFSQADRLKRHKLIHTGLSQFVCDMCNKVFTRVDKLKRHKLIHTSFKQFACDVCSKTFTKVGNLKRHKLIHTGLKQFVCDVCSEAFSQANDLKRHKLIHTSCSTICV